MSSRPFTRVTVPERAVRIVVSVVADDPRRDAATPGHGAAASLGYSAAARVFCWVNFMYRYSPLRMGSYLAGFSSSKQVGMHSMTAS